MGIPDAFICMKSVPFFVELKCTKGDRVDIRPSQIAWNMAYNRAGGVSFFLVNRLSKGDLFLFYGFQGPDLLRDGLETRPLYHGTSLASCVWAMYEEAREHFHLATQIQVPSNESLAPCD